MKASILTAVACLAASAAATPVVKRGSNSFAGTSLYFLQGLSAEAQKSYLSALADGGIKVIRLWLSDQPGGGRCVKGSVSQTGVPEFETTIGQYNWETIDLLDQSLVYVQEAGLKAIISPHDGNKLNGPNGNDIYGQTFGSGYFYEKDEAYSAFDKRLSAILNYQGKHSGKVWKDWSDVILAVDLENEPFASEPAKCKYASAATWACGRAQNIRNILGNDSPIKVATGGFGGDISHDCTFAAGAGSCAAIDIVSVHRYAGPEGSNPGQWGGSYGGWRSSAGGKLVHLEEWGVNTNSYDPKSEFPANTEDMNAAGLPWAYWQLLPSKQCDSNDGDGFGFFVDQGVDWQSQAKAAAAAGSPQDWSGLV